MSRRIEIAGNCLAEVLNFLILLAVEIILFIDFIEWQPEIIRLVFPVVFNLLYYLVREKCENPFLFFLFHCLPAAFIFFIWGKTAPEKAVLTIGALTFALISTGRKLSKGKAGIGAGNPLLAAGVFLILYLTDALQMEGKAGGYLLFITALYLSLYFFYYYLKKFYVFMDINSRSTEKAPFRHMFYTASVFAGCFSAAAFMFISFLSDRRLLDSIGAFLRKGIKAFFTFLFSFVKPEMAQQELLPDALQEAQQAGDIAAVGKNHPFLEKFSQVFLTLTAAVVITGLTIMAVMGIYRLLREVFFKKEKRTSAIKAYREDKVETLKKEEKRERNKKEGHLLFKTPAEKIRRIYYKTVYDKARSMGDEGIEKMLLYATPRQCCRRIWGDKEEAGKMAAIYEKARYGPAGCSTEDVRQLKKYVQRIKQAEK